METAEGNEQFNKYIPYPFCRCPLDIQSFHSTWQMKFMSIVVRAEQCALRPRVDKFHANITGN